MYGCSCIVCAFAYMYVHMNTPIYIIRTQKYTHMHADTYAYTHMYITRDLIVDDRGLNSLLMANANDL